MAVSAREAQEARALTYGMIAMVDDAVGRIRAAAEDAGVAGRTVQIYTSDHGDHLGEHRLLFKGAEQYDSLTHVPFIWADPWGTAHDHPTWRRRMISARPFWTMPGSRHRSGCRGRSWRLPAGRARCRAYQYETQRTQGAFGVRPRVHSIVHDRWRLSIYLGPCRNELFDLETDPGEMVNLWDSADHAPVRAMLVERLAEMEIAAVDRVPLPTSEA